jgi:choline dehydrogenase
MRDATELVSEADYVVVGAGSAGCVLAERLTADGRSSVVLLESGGAMASLTVKVPALIQKQPNAYNWLYATEPDPSRRGAADPYSAGRGLGGSSGVNAMLWSRGHPGDYDAWAAAGATGWHHEALLPAFRRSERFEEPAPERGRHGPMRVARTRVDNPMIGHFIEAAAQRGFPEIADFNGPVREGVSRSQVNQRRGFRHTAADAYLARARHRSNLSLRTGAHVSRVIVAGGRATAVEYVDSAGVRHHVRAQREVLVAAGAIGSPRLLLLSGIGPAAASRRLGIAVKADVAEVGQGLQEHPATSLTFHVTERTVNQEVTPLRLVRHGLDFVLRGRGALTTTANHAVAFGRTSPGAVVPDTELVFMAFGLQAATDDPDDPQDGSRPRPAGSWLARATARSGGREEGRKQVATEPLVTVTAVLLHPRGRGQVTLGSPDHREPPVIRQALLEDEQDVDGLIRAARRAREVFSAPAMAPYVTGERSPGTRVRTDEEWAEHLRGATFRLFHPAGTCRMGGPGSVVDERLRVRGVAALRVIDASVMPTLPSGNIQAPTIMIGERGSELVLEDRR